MDRIYTAIILFFIISNPIYSQSFSLQDFKRFRQFDFHDKVQDTIKWQSVYRLENLEELFESNLEIKNLYLNIGNLDSTNVNILEKIKGFDDLKNLKIVFNKIEEMPKVIFELDSLEGLFIYSRSLKEIPDSIKKLRQLKYLTFGVVNNLEKISPELFLLNKLEELVFTGLKKGVKVPNLFGAMPHLKRLCFFSIPEELPSSIENLKSLEYLVFDTPYRGEFPKGIYDLPNLKYLYLDLQKQKDLIGISKLQSLEMLHLSGKPPIEEVFDLNNLKFLFLSSTYKRDLNLQGLRKLKKLEGLIIWSYHNLQSGLEIINGLSNLKFISINNCDKLVEIPNLNLPKLSYLQFFGNKELKKYPRVVNGIKATLKEDYNYNF